MEGFHFFHIDQWFTCHLIFWVQDNWLSISNLGIIVKQGVKRRATRLNAHLVKSFEDVNAGLMDSAHNSSASIDSVANSAHHNGSSPSIKTTGRFIHENDGGVSHQFYSYGQSFTLLCWQPSNPRESHQGALQRLQLHKLHHLFNELLHIRKELIQ